MFTGYTDQTVDVFWGIRFNNDRAWFAEHKQEFQDAVMTPTKALAGELYDWFQKQYPDLHLNVHISRIYRDARRLFGRGPYKDHLWFSIKHGSILLEGPMFWFEIGAADYSYGMGFYSATPSQMEAFRRSLDANPARFERIVRKIERGGGFRLTGEEYKRPKGHADDPLGRWYNRKRIGLECSRDYDAALYSPELPEILSDAYAKLMPMYEYFLEFYHSADSEKGEKP